MTFYEDLFSTLEEHRIRYLVVGGIAVVLHGFIRATADLDLMVALDRDNLNAFLGIVKQRGYKPKVPVALEDFADPNNRRAWIQEKGMKVFSLYHPGKPRELIDIFVDEPIPFEEAYKQRKVMKIFSMSVSVINASHLIELKRKAGRPQDLEDIRALEDLRKKRPDE